MPSPFKGTPAQLGAFLLAYTHQRVLTSPSVNELRSLVFEEGVPADKRESFDDVLLLLVVFAAYVSARRKFPIRIADEFLDGSLSPILSKCGESDAQAIRDRMNFYRQVCPGSAVRIADLGNLASLFLLELYDDEQGKDALFNLTVHKWLAAYTKFLDDFMDAVEIVET